MTPEIKSAIGRLRAVRGDGGLATGTAFVVADRYLLTAFHVVGDKAASAARGSPVFYRNLLFDPGGNESAAIAVKPVENACDAISDWALLEADAPIANARPLPMGEVSQKEVQTYRQASAKLEFESWGFATVARLTRSGITISGRIQDSTANYQDAWVYELYSENAAAAFGDPLNGMSGAPCLVDGAVVGIIRTNLIDPPSVPGERLHIVGGKLYACPVSTDTLQVRCSAFLPALDPVRGLPGLPHQELPPVPFRYLRWYGAEHADVFFGRSNKLREFFHQITNRDGPSVALIYGRSGVGKSSLLEAGALPRLSLGHEVRVQRRETGRSLEQTLDDQFSSAMAAKNGKPAIIVLDQIEEVFTDSRLDGDAEIVALCQCLKRKIDDEVRPFKVVLGFRSEWLANIRARLADARINFSELYLERLTRDEIEEIVRGVASTARLRASYNVGVDDDLPRRIADDLLADPLSPVTPVLSIILTRLWAEAKTHRGGDQRLSRQVYDERMRSKSDLDQFLTQQLAEVAQVRPADIKSGLVNDVLYRHTTELGTARELSWEELRDLYRHFDLPSDDRYLRDLVEALCAKSLLYSATDDEPAAVAKSRSTRLTHDTLAPPVRRNYERSEFLGQRAERRLAYLANDWQPESPDEGLLERKTLEMIDAGARGMRAASPQELGLIDASRKAVSRKKRLRRISEVAVVAAVAVGICGYLYSTTNYSHVRSGVRSVDIGSPVGDDQKRLFRAMLLSGNSAVALQAIDEMKNELIFTELVDVAASNGLGRFALQWIKDRSWLKDRSRIFTRLTSTLVQNDQFELALASAKEIQPQDATVTAPPPPPITFIETSNAQEPLCPSLAASRIGMQRRRSDQAARWDDRFAALIEVAKYADRGVQEEALQLALQTERQMPQTLSALRTLATEFSASDKPEVANEFGKSDKQKIVRALLWEIAGVACQDASGWSDVVSRNNNIDLMERYLGSSVVDQIFQGRPELSNTPALAERKVRLYIKRGELDRAALLTIQQLENFPAFLQGGAPTAALIFQNNRDADLWPRLMAAAQKATSDDRRNFFWSLVTMNKPQYVAKAATIISDPADRRDMLYELLAKNRDEAVDREVKASWARLGGSLVEPKMPEADKYYRLFSEVLFDTGYPEEAKGLFEVSESKEPAFCYRIAGYLMENGRGADGKNWLSRCPEPSGGNIISGKQKSSFWRAFSGIIDRYIKDHDVGAILEMAGSHHKMAARDLIDFLGLASDKLWTSGYRPEAQQLDRKALQETLSTELSAKYDMNVAVRLAMRLANHDLSGEARPLVDRLKAAVERFDLERDIFVIEPPRRQNVWFVLASTWAIVGLPDAAIAELSNLLRDEKLDLDAWQTALVQSLDEPAFEKALGNDVTPQYPALMLESRLRLFNKWKEAERAVSAVKDARWMNNFVAAVAFLRDPVADLTESKLDPKSFIFQQNLKNLASAGQIDRALSLGASLPCAQRFDLYLDWFGFDASGKPDVKIRLFDALIRTASETESGQTCPIESKKIADLLREPVSMHPQLRSFLISLADRDEDLRPLAAIKLAALGDFQDAVRVCKRCDRRDMAMLTTAMLEYHYGFGEN